MERIKQKLQVMHDALTTLEDSIKLYEKYKEQAAANPTHENKQLA